jgi:hypothetical protein
MVACQGVTVYQVDVVRERNSLFGKKRVVVQTAQFATHSEAYWWAQQFVGYGHAIELMDIGYVRNHPVEVAYDEQHQVNEYIKIIQDYFGDEVCEHNWEKYADKMEEMEEAKSSRWQSDDSVPF